jgi:glycosyltransferase Alg8
MLTHVLYLLVCLALALTLPFHALSASGQLIFSLGVIGAWRYGWTLTNFTRALLYIKSAYPRRRVKAERAYAIRAVRTHAYFLVTSYKVETAISIRVYQSIFRAACRSPGGSTVVASVVEAADQNLIEACFAGIVGPDDDVRLIIDRIPGTGKRDALATSLSSIARQQPAREDIVLLVDGDTIVPADIVERSAPFFTESNLGAVTTDEASEIERNSLFKDWFSLRFTQRQMMMSSVALGRRVLTLTGRMSIFRGDLAIKPDFIAAVRSDYVDHWRLGRINFLTGDDKSTWYWLLRNGYEMAYLPDVQSVSMETQPLPGFTASAVTLMIRWFGNMLRTNGRAMVLRPRDIGWFTWWSILDQRISMWTTLAGPASVFIAALFVDPMILPAYLVWVMLTRYLNCWLLAVFRGPFPITYPFLLYFGQLVGSLVKTYVLFRLDRQKWTRQATASGGGASPASSLRTLSSTFVHSLAFVWFLTAVLIVSGFVLNPFT